MLALYSTQKITVMFCLSFSHRLGSCNSWLRHGGPTESLHAWRTWLPYASTIIAALCSMYERKTRERDTLLWHHEREASEIYVNKDKVKGYWSKVKGELAMQQPALLSFYVWNAIIVALTLVSAVLNFHASIYHIETWCFEKKKLDIWRTEVKG